MGAKSADKSRRTGLLRRIPALRSRRMSAPSMLLRSSTGTDTAEAEEPVPPDEMIASLKLLEIDAAVSSDDDDDDDDMDSTSSECSTCGFRCTGEISSAGKPRGCTCCAETVMSSTRSASTIESTVSTSSAIKRVTFMTLHIREYNQILGDHPCCENGLPVTLGWDFSESCVGIDDFEADRQETRKPKDQLKLSFHDRTQILAGYSEEDRRRVQRKLQRERRCNQRSSRRTNRSFFQSPAMAVATTEQATTTTVDTAPTSGVC